MTQKHPLLVGAHMSIAGGFPLSVERAVQTGCTTMQIFTKSNRSWFAKNPISPDEAQQFIHAVKLASLSHVVVHSGYLINLGASDKKTAIMSMRSLKHEMERCIALGIKCLVLHPGAHTGSGAQTAITQIAQLLDEAFDAVPDAPTIALETAAGQGTTIGTTFEELRAIYEQSTHKRKIGFCIDTCHIFAAGYDLTSPSGYHATMQQFDAILGLEKLKVIHLNDSQMVLGSRRDRHQKIGKGEIPVVIFETIINDRRLVDIPKILETPVDDPIREYSEEIALLKSLKN